MRVRALLIVSGAALLLAAGTARADSVTLVPAQDNTLYQESGALSNGVGTALFVGRVNNGLRRRALLRFDLATIPAGSTISSARLSFAVDRTIAGPVVMGLHRVAAAWGEGASNAGANGSLGGMGAPAQAGDATWSHRIYPSLAWTTPGGDFTATPSASTIVSERGEFVFESSTGLVQDLQSFLDQPMQNFGWLVLSNESQAPPTAKRVGSREASDPAARPQLLVVYQAPAVPVPMVSWWSLALLAVVMLGAAATRRERVL